MQKIVYLDNQSTTCVAPEVLECILPYLSEQYGNPSSNHILGKNARSAIDNARDQLARSINASSDEILFTSGTTESINIIIRGITESLGSRGNHIITVLTEHKAVLSTYKYMEGKGFAVTYLSVKENGLIDLEDLLEAITDQTILVTVMHANNEIGVIQPVAEIGKICNDHGVLFFSDGAQAFGKIPVDVEELGVSFYALSSHKVYGPKGIGAIYVRRADKQFLPPFIYGGGQEKGIRSGTENVPGIIGFGKACNLVSANLQQEFIRILELRSRLFDGIVANIPDAELNGDWETRLPGNLNLCFKGVESDLLLNRMTDICLSAGSACSANTLHPSHVLLALGQNAEMANSAVRFSIGRYTINEEIDYVLERLIMEVSKIRKTLAYGNA